MTTLAPAPTRSYGPALALAGAVALLVAFAGALIGFRMYADSPDQRMLGHAEQIGVQASDQQVIDAAHKACGALSTGHTMYGAGVQVADQVGLRGAVRARLMAFAASAQQVYCPDASFNYSHGGGQG